MKRWGLFLLRLTTGWLLVLWGIDKLQNVDHGVAVSEAFYLGLASNTTLLQVFGVFQILVGTMVMAGLKRNLAYPVMMVMLIGGALGVWKSILDPWGWFLDGTQVLFYPSAIIAAATLVLYGTRDQDCMTMDKIMGGG